MGDRTEFPVAKASAANSVVAHYSLALTLLTLPSDFAGLARHYEKWKIDSVEGSMKAVSRYNMTGSEVVAEDMSRERCCLPERVAMSGLKMDSGCSCRLVKLLHVDGRWRVGFLVQTWTC